MDFEKKAHDEAQRYTSMEQRKKSERKLIEGYWHNELQKIKALEKELQSEMKKNYKNYCWISALFPITCHQNTSVEISSDGYNSLFNFHEYIQIHQEGFIIYCFKKRFYSNFTSVESYLKNANVFNSNSKLPEKFLAGIMIQLLFILLLLCNSYRRFKRSMFGSNPKEVCERPKGNVLRMKRGEFNAWVVNGENFKNKLYSLLSGQYDWFKKNGTNWNVFINGRNASECSYRAIPGDIKVDDFISLLARLSGADQLTVDKIYERISGEIKSIDFKGKHFSKLKDQVRADILLNVTRLKKSADCIYMVYDIGIGLPTAFHSRIKERLDELKNEGAVVMLLMSNDLTYYQIIV
jgi:hypothetical protein